MSGKSAEMFSFFSRQKPFRQGVIIAIMFLIYFYKINNNKNGLLHQDQIILKAVTIINRGIEVNTQFSLISSVGNIAHQHCWLAKFYHYNRNNNKQYYLPHSGVVRSVLLHQTHLTSVLKSKPLH